MTDSGDKDLIKKVATLIKNGVAMAGSAHKFDGPRDGSIGIMDASMIAKEAIDIVRQHDAEAKPSP